ncbi:ABC transporter permease [Aquiflexum sp.]|uniref:ABC transporter permease n=1 Tax=Aquiflexum sp. TaxID=1872584 RepID=UPI0035948BE8
MLKNHFIIAWRSLKKNKLISVINILGLALGICTCLVISLFVMDELSYDRFHANADRIYRVNLQAKMGKEFLNEASVMAPVAEAFVDEIPEVESATRISNHHQNTKIRIGEKVIRKGATVFVDPNFFEIFDLPFIKGDPKTALSKPNSIVLTRDQAKLLFEGNDPIDQLVKLEDIGYYDGGYQSLAGDFIVTGVIENIPTASHFHFDIFASMLGNPHSNNLSWLSGSYSTYLLLADGAKADQVQEKVPAIVQKYMESQMIQGLGMNFEEFFESGNFVYLNLQPLTEIHLSSVFKGQGQFEAGGDMKTVIIYCIIAVFMLVVACINFMNLSTAGASKRMKEIGVRKVMGSEKRHLMFQFLAESFVSICLATLFGIVLASFTMPYFNEFTDKAISLGVLFNPKIWAVLLGMILVVTVMAGGYPAFFLSGFKPVDSLKKKMSTNTKGAFRSGLVVFQFSVSVILIIGTIVVMQQMDYIQNRDNGYQRDQLIVLREAGLLGSQLDVFKDKLKSDPRIRHVTKSAYIPAGPTDTSSQNIKSKDSPDSQIRTIQFGIDEEYLATMGMELIMGRNFSLEFGTEKSNVILNETAVKELGIANDPIGKTLERMTDLQGGKEEVIVIGVVKDFVARSLREPIKPLMMIYNPYYSLILKTDSNDLNGLLSDMEEMWASFNTGEDFHYAFLDELYNETYIQEAKMGSFLTVLAGMTIFVACLGLFGLVTFTAEQRLKEIGIRKVLGSTIGQIVGMLTKDFIKLIGLALLISFPAGYYFMELWLKNFAYHVDIEWWIFALAGLITILIALATIFSRSIKAALMNPVENLRSE